ncbi:MAG: dethiobiotin synthase [Microthrixaceae bacterium]|nr:dethiobiotin synthase [Microthrixaceae bacterium]
MSARPRRLLAVAGTSTEVGKTFVSAAVIDRLVADGWNVEVRKPAQSANPGEPTDSEVLAAASGEPHERICPPNRTYSVAMAPPMAAAVLGLTAPTTDELVDEVEGSWGALSADVGIVELAGGVASPMAVDGDGADLAATFRPDAVLLVADAGLGTINAVRLCLARLDEALSLSSAAAGASDGVVDTPVLVFMNRYDDANDLHHRNAQWLAHQDHVVLATGLEELVDWVLSLAPRLCGYCAKAVPDDCDGACGPEFDLDRYCVRCGRRLVVSMNPVKAIGRCKVHGLECA